MKHTKYYITTTQVKLLPDCSPHWPKVYKYAKLMEKGVRFPPVKIHFDRIQNRWTYNDGRHRVMAAKLAGVRLYVKSKKVMGEKIQPKYYYQVKYKTKKDDNIRVTDKYYECTEYFLFDLFLMDASDFEILELVETTKITESEYLLKILDDINEN